MYMNVYKLKYLIIFWIIFVDFVIFVVLGFFVNGFVNIFWILFFGFLVWICFKCDKLRLFIINFWSIKVDKILYFNKGFKDFLYV